MYFSFSKKKKKRKTIGTNFFTLPIEILCKLPTLKLKKSKYRVSIRDPLLWNNILTAAEKIQESLPKFRATIKEKLLSMTNEINFF